jgi:2-polyprenyl-3-methyl-5-hydroxy-6-metoxy-1,4-benzoquinol methylase
MDARNHESFPAIKRRFKSAVQSILDHHSSYEIDEAALPAYAHKNPFIDDIFWRRIKIAYHYALANGSQRVLDFGCGTGLLSYALAAAGKDVVAIDLNLGPLHRCSLLQLRVQVQIHRFVPKVAIQLQLIGEVWIEQRLARWHSLK